MKRTPQSPMAELRVIKKLAPGVRGTKALTAAYGAALVCVRHRLDASATKRLTTVELLVAKPSSSAARARPWTLRCAHTTRN